MAIRRRALAIPGPPSAARLTEGVPPVKFATRFPESSQTMAVTIRLTRAGSKKVPFYRVVAADRRSPRDGRFIEQLGVYDPLRDPVEFRVERERLDHWLKTARCPARRWASSCAASASRRRGSSEGVVASVV